MLVKKKWMVALFATVLITLFLAVLVMIKVFLNGLEEYYSQYWVSQSLDDARKKGVLVKECGIFPNEIVKDDLVIQFKDCWIEEQTQVIYKFLFFKTKKRLGSYNLCFTLASMDPWDLEEKHLFFVKEDLGSSFGGGRSVFSDKITVLTPHTFRVSLIQSWKDERAKDISFTIP